MSNRFYVLTGGLATGKTEIIKGLASIGYKTYPELEQSVLDEYFKETEPKENPILYATEWFNKKVSQYKSASKKKLCFFDRGILDPLSIFLFLGLPIPKKLKKIKNKIKYASPIFLIEQIPKEWYGGSWPRKILSEEESQRFEKIIKEFYKKEGYEVISVPPMNIKDRINFIINYINYEIPSKKSGL